MDFADQKPKRLGLALGGGAIRGIAHIGVLKALVEHQIPISCVSGTSSGALVGGLFAAGLSPDYMVEHVARLAWSNIAGFQLSKRGMVSSHPIEKLVEKHVGPIRLGDLKLPFSGVATDILTGEKVLMMDSNLKLSEVIRASTSFPGVYTPMKIDGRTVIDGGAASNVPVSEVRVLGADVVLAVDVIPKVILTDVPDNLATMADRGLDLLLSKAAQHAIKEADMSIFPIRENITSFDIKKSDRMIELGYQAVKNHLEEIQALFK